MHAVPAVLENTLTKAGAALYAVIERLFSFENITRSHTRADSMTNYIIETDHTKLSSEMSYKVCWYIRDIAFILRKCILNSYYTDS